MKFEIKKVDDTTSPIRQYGIEILTDCDVNDPCAGSSEMDWYNTEEDRDEEYNRKIKCISDLGIF